MEMIISDFMSKLGYIWLEIEQLHVDMGLGFPSNESATQSEM